MKTEIEKFTIPKDSPWAILAAYLAQKNEEDKVYKIKEYVYLQDKRDTAIAKGTVAEAALQKNEFERFNQLKTEFSKAYFSTSDFQDYLTADRTNPNKVKPQDAEDFARRIVQLKSYFADILNNPEEGIKKPLERSVEANSRRVKNVEDLFQQTADPKGLKPWQVKPSENDASSSGKTTDANTANKFSTFVGDALRKNKSRLSDAIALTKDINTDRGGERRNEYIQGLTAIQRFLDSPNPKKSDPNQKENVSLIDLTYVIGEHRGATQFRESTTGYYEPIDAFIDGLGIRMPKYERSRDEVDLTHNCVDPKLQTLAYTAKLSYVNAKHHLGLTPDDIDIYGTTLGTVSAIMRGYGIEEIDDRFKHYLHNTADHSLRTCVTIASIRDMSKKSLEYLYHKEMEAAANDPNKQGELTSALEIQKKTLDSDAKRYVKQACLHDTGEFLNEVLGNNLQGTDPAEEAALRSMRDRLEKHIQSTYVFPEVETRLKTEYPSKWKKDRIERYKTEVDSLMGLSHNGAIHDGYDFEHKFYEKAFEVVERLNTNHDITTLRTVGKITPDNQWQNVNTTNKAAARYTLQYVWSIFSGNKFQEDDPNLVAKHEAREEHRQNVLEPSNNDKNTISIKAGVALQHNPKATNSRNIGNTHRPLDDFMNQTDIDYPKSIFKQFAKATIRDYQTLPLEVARARQLSNEVFLHSMAEEMIHYAKKVGRVDPVLNEHKVEKGARKIVAQGVHKAILELQEHNIDMLYFQPARFVEAEKRYPVGNITIPTSPNSVDSAGGHPVQIIPTPVFDAAAAIMAAGSEVLQRAVKNPLDRSFRMLMESQNKRFTEKKFNDLVQTVTLLRDESNSKTVKDPELYKKAVDECYKHVLGNFHDPIPVYLSEQFGINHEAMQTLLIRKNMESGDYHKSGKVSAAVGKEAEKMYEYFQKKYRPGSNAEPIAEYDSAEHYMLHKLLQERIAKISDIQNTQTGKAQILRNEEKLTSLRYADNAIPQGLSSVSVSSDSSHKALVLLGKALLDSSDEQEKTVYRQIFGAGLMMKGLAGHARTAIRHVANAIPDNGLQLKREPQGLYIVKDTQCTIGGTTNAALADALEQSTRLSTKHTAAGEQLHDVKDAFITALKQALTGKRNKEITRPYNRHIYAAAAQMMDQSNSAVAPVIALAQGKLANVYMAKIVEALDSETPLDFASLQKEVSRNLTVKHDHVVEYLLNKFSDSWAGKKLQAEAGKVAPEGLVEALTARLTKGKKNVVSASL